MELKGITKCRADMGDYLDKLDDDYIDVDGNGDNGVYDDIMIFNRWNNCSYIEDLNTSEF